MTTLTFDRPMVDTIMTFAQTGDTSVLRKHGDTFLRDFKSTEEVLHWAVKQLMPWDKKYPGLLAEIGPFCGAWFQLAQTGWPHFTLTPDFFYAVTLTDFGDLTDEPLYLPFHAFTVSFPKTERFGGANKILVYRLPQLEMTREGLFQVNWKLVQASLMKETPIFTRWPLGATRQMLGQEVLDDPTDEEGVRPLDPEEKAFPRRVRLLLANTMSYIESQGPLPTQRRTKHAEPQAVERVHSDRPLYDVGRTVKLSPQIRHIFQSSGEERQRFHVAQRFVVRGHWRNQAYGEGRLLRRRQWIEPFWKGPENVEEALSRSYEVI